MKKSNTVWLFPGQGSQRPAMAAGLSGASELFDKANEVLGIDLKALCTTDSRPSWAPEQLQPALFITSVAAAGAAQSRGLKPSAVAGHSLGEYAALVAAGGLSFEDGLKVVSARAKAMAAAARRHSGAMAAVIGLDPSTVEEICSEIGDVWVANYNTPVQTVISGKQKRLFKAADKCLGAGAGRVIRLDVPVAGHCPLMQPAQAPVRAALEQAEVTVPGTTFYSVARARPVSDPQEIIDALVAAIVSPVRFVQTVDAIAADAGEIVEVGPGRVLSGLVRQIIAGAKPKSVSSDGEAEAMSAEGSRDRSRKNATAEHSGRLDPAGVC